MKDLVSIPLYLAIIAFNCIEVYLIAKKPAKKRLKSERMLLSLSIGDILLGLNGVIGFLREIKVIPTTRFIVTFLNSFIIFSVTFSILHIFLLTMDRFISVYYPIRRRTIMSNKLVDTSLAVIWVVSLVTSPLIVWHSIAHKSIIYPVFLSIEVFPTLIFVLFAYVMIYRKLRGSVMLNNSNGEASRSSGTNGNSSNGYSMTYVEAQGNLEPPSTKNGIKDGMGLSTCDKNGIKDGPNEAHSLRTASITLQYEEKADSMKERPSSVGGEDMAQKQDVTENHAPNAGVELGQNAQDTKPIAQPHNSRTYTQEKRILMLGISIIVSFAICFLPATIAFLVFLRFSKKSMPYFVLAYFFAVLNSISNPVLYFFYRYWEKARRYCCCCC